MEYEKFVKQQIKNPIALTAYIILSCIAFIQMISLFLGRWFDIIEFASTVLLVVVSWIAFSQAVSRKTSNKKAVITCVFAWTIVKLVSIGLAIIMTLISSIYMCVVSKTCYSNALMIAGILTLILVFGIYVMRLIITIFALKDVIRLRKYTGGIFQFKNNWFTWGIVTAALRLAGLILLIIISVLAHSPLQILGYFGSISFGNIIASGISTGSVVCVSIIDMCYVAFMIMFIINMNVYQKAVGRKNQ